MLRAVIFAFLCFFLTTENGNAQAFTLAAAGPVKKGAGMGYGGGWTTPNFWKNDTGVPMVIKSLTISLSARPLMGESAFDICGVIGDDRDFDLQTGGRYFTVNDIEVVCISVHKSEADSNFNQTNFEIAFPGQGLFLPDQSTFYFEIAGHAVNVASALDEAADASFVALITPVDINASELPVQALRTPFIDRRFFGISSGLASHTNTSNHVRPVLGLWSYITTRTSSVIQHCTGTKGRDDSAWGQQCTPINPNGNITPGPVVLRYPGYEFRPGDKIAEQCMLGIADPTGTICASYFYVAIPKEDGVYVPLSRNETILQEDARSFCEVAAGPEYQMSDPRTANVADCKTLLEPVGMNPTSRIAFGGMYGYGYNGTPQTYPNPVTGTDSCPSSYEAVQLLGTEFVDYPIFYCYKILEASEVPTYDFGGAYGYGSPTYFVNPFTSGLNCPTGFSSQKALDTVNLDYEFRYCIRSHISGAANFQGLFGWGNNGDAVAYGNPRTGKNQCPQGTAETTVFGTTGLDYPIVMCH